MNKKYIVRLGEQERNTCMDVIKKLKGTSQKVRRAHILLKADVNGPGWTDAKIGEGVRLSNSDDRESQKAASH